MATENNNGKPTPQISAVVAFFYSQLVICQIRFRCPIYFIIAAESRPDRSKSTFVRVYIPAFTYICIIMTLHIAYLCCPMTVVFRRDGKNRNGTGTRRSWRRCSFRLHFEKFVNDITSQFPRCRTVRVLFEILIRRFRSKRKKRSAM